MVRFPLFVYYMLPLLMYSANQQCMAQVPNSNVAMPTKAWAEHVAKEKSSLRGLFAIDRSTAWACGSEGTIIRCRNATLPSIAFDIFAIPGFEKSEFRSIHAWDANTCIVATAGQPAKIFKTTDGGQTWKTVFSSDHAASFFNGMKFFNPSEGVVFGDPLSGCLELLVTLNSGDSWKRLNVENSPPVFDGEAGFAASNSSMLLLRDDVWIGLGGRNGVARILRCTNFRKNASHNTTLHWSSMEIPLLSSSPSRGIFSLASAGQSVVAVGGDYKEMVNKDGTIAVSDLTGKSWRVPLQQSTRGFRSCVIFSATDQHWIAVGPTGSDVAIELDRWQPHSDIGFHTLHVASDGSVWAAGAGGRVGRWIDPK
jgi:photosystem II stability/assembly factor-like uncharacterized protein